MIIVEGPDGAGKTHLAQRICERFDLKYMRYDRLSSVTGPDGPAIVEWWDDQLAADSDGVYDRCFYISEPIYQLATPGRKLLIDGHKMLEGISRLINFQPLTIFCLPPWEAAIANVGQKERLEGVDDHALEKIHWAYWTSLAHWGEMMFGNVIRWDYTQHDEGLLLEAVEAYQEGG
jgi:hypothetical protein